MRALSDWPRAERAAIDYLLADIDDTITEDGRLPAASLAAMERLQAAGIRLVPVTGRPAGWCDHIARMWPVDGVVGENGAFFMTYDRDARKMRYGYAKSDEERRDDRQRLARLGCEILNAVPGSGLASDQPFRIADLAIDFCEDVAPLDKASIRRIVDLFEAAGATAKVSSIHVNGWFGSYDKLSMTRRLMVECFALDIDAAGGAIAYVGDSPNDQPMFGYFANSVGVANVRDFELEQPPRWVAVGRSAKGFVELAESLIEARR